MKTFGSIWRVAVAQLFATSPDARGALYLGDDGALQLIDFSEDPPKASEFVCIITPTIERDWIARQLCAVFNDNAQAA